MKKLVKKLLKKAQKMDIWDWALLKMTLIAFGILIGAYFNFGAYLICVWFVAIVGWMMLFYTFYIKK